MLGIKYKNIKKHNNIKHKHKTLRSILITYHQKSKPNLVETLEINKLNTYNQHTI